MSYMIGTSITLTATIRDEDGVLADPAVVNFKILPPDGVEADFVYGVDAELIKDSVGIYHLVYLATDPGPFSWRAEGVGTVDVAAEDDFTIDAGVF